MFQWQIFKHSKVIVKGLGLLLLAFLIIALFKGTTEMRAIDAKIKAHPLVFQLSDVITSAKIVYDMPNCEMQKNSEDESSNVTPCFTQFDFN